MRMLEAHPAGAGGCTLNYLLGGTAGRGLYLVIILLALPFIVPLPLPGLSTILGAIIALLSLRLAFGLPPRLPAAFGERSLPEGVRKRLLGGSVRFLRWIERWVRPRRTQWMGWRSVQCAHGLLLALMALLLALPLPPIMPFSNSLPSYAIILIAVSMMEEDGVLIWFGHAAALVTLITFATFGGVIVAFAGRLFQSAAEYLQSFQ